MPSLPSIPWSLQARLSTLPRSQMAVEMVGVGWGPACSRLKGPIGAGQTALADPVTEPLEMVRVARLGLEKK